MNNFFQRLFGSNESEVEKKIREEAREVRAFSDLNAALNSATSLADEGKANLEAFEAYKAKIMPKQ